MNKLSIEELQARIIARGEFSDHCHVIVGPCTIERIDDKVYINAEDGQAVMKHLIESKYMTGEQVWTGEHKDITLTGTEVCERHGDVILKKVAPGRYEYIPQLEFDPFEDIIRRVRD